MNQIAIMESKIEVLCKQVDDLKCCGNCKKYPVARECRNRATPKSYCGGWLPDGLTRKDRE
jgi:hypothetical protein